MSYYCHPTVVVVALVPRQQGRQQQPRPSTWNEHGWPRRYRSFHKHLPLNPYPVVRLHRRDDNDNDVVPYENDDDDDVTDVVLLDVDDTVQDVVDTTMEANWEIHYQEYLNYTQTTGNHNVPLHHPTLGKWIRMQRMHYKQWQQGQIHSMDSLGDAPMDRVGITASTIGAAGDTTTTSMTATTTTKTEQEHRLELLLRAGFIFQVQDYEWMKQYQALQTYRDIHGHCRVPSSRNSSAAFTTAATMTTTAMKEDTISPSLGLWVKNQRMQYKRGTLAQDRIELLNAVDFCWNPTEWQYRDNIRQVLQRCQEQQKSITDWKVTDGPLGLWMCRQRTLYRKYCRCCNDNPDDTTGTNHATNDYTYTRNVNGGGQGGYLKPYQIELLEQELGFDCSGYPCHQQPQPRPPDFVDWSERMRQLEQFQREHGHLNVPRTYTKHANLGSWVAKVRERYRHYGSSSSPSLSSSSSASSKRIQQRLQDLEDIGFVWDVLEYKWQQKFQQLIVFYEKHGHVDVPDTMAGLGSWVKDQRREFKKIKQGEPSRLTPQHARALHRLGLDWYRQQTVRREKQTVFMKRLQEYQDYCNEYSYCVDDDDDDDSHGHGDDIDDDDSNVHGDDDEDDNSTRDDSDTTFTGVVLLPSVRSMPQQLRNWVERQRKLYRKWLQGNYDMTDERRCLLEDSGVVQGIMKD